MSVQENDIEKPGKFAYISSMKHTQKLFHFTLIAAALFALASSVAFAGPI
jgi:hypothetical protein